jgi:hypothetical protein
MLKKHHELFNNVFGEFEGNHEKGFLVILGCIPIGVFEGWLYGRPILAIIIGLSAVVYIQMNLYKAFKKRKELGELVRSEEQNYNLKIEKIDEEKELRRLEKESFERIIEEKANITDITSMLMRTISKKESLDIKEKTQLSFIVAGILSVYKENNWDVEELKLTSELESDVKRINQIEIIIDHYSERIKKVKEDKNLDETERENKLKYWLRLRDRDIDRIEE